MPPVRAKIPLSKGLYTNSDAMETQDFATVLTNCFNTKAGATVKRPGLALAVDLATDKPVEGLYWFNEASHALAVSDGKVFKITKTGATYSKSELTGSTLRNATQTGGTGRVVFTDDGVNVLMANGGAINYFVAGNSTSGPLADGDAPTAVSHLAYLNGRILANGDGTGKFYWSDIGNSLSWNATSWATAESDADWILHLGVGFKELVLFGEQSIEIWYDDGGTPFVPIPGAFIQRGISSQDSPQFINGVWVFQDEQNNICRMKDREIEIVSTPIEKELKELGNVTDGLSSRIDIAGESFYLISFPYADRTFAWNISGGATDGWSEFSSGAGRFAGQVHARCTSWASDLVGDKTTGKIWVLSTDNVDDAGTAITATRRTGWIDHGTMNSKNCISLYFKTTDAANDNVTAPVVAFRYRDDGSETWSSWTNVSMTGDAIKRVTQLGRYRSRQWEFANSQRCIMDLVMIEEELEVMVL